MATTTKVYKGKTAESGILPFMFADTPGYREMREYGNMVLDRLDNRDDITKARPVTQVEEAQLGFMLRQFMDMLINFYINACPEILSRRQYQYHYPDRSLPAEIAIQVRDSLTRLTIRENGGEGLR
jgi:hypothetical protein